MAKHILIVDDEPNIVLSLEFLMKKEGYEVRSVGNGYELCQELRAETSWKEIKIIMLTAKGRDVEREKGLALGADDYITKPFATQEVVEKVKSLLG